MTLRPALPADIPQITALLDAAFAPSRYESTLIRLVMEGSEAAHHAWIAEHEGEAVGYVLYTVATRDGSPIGHHLAPVAVLPEHQRRGIGSALIRQSLQQSPLATSAIFVLGDPAYYERFGFTPVTDALCPYDKGNTHFRALRWNSDPAIPFTIGYIDAFSAAEG